MSVLAEKDSLVFVREQEPKKPALSEVATFIEILKEKSLIDICIKASNNHVRSLGVSVAGTMVAVGGLLLSSNSVIGMSICASAALFVSFKDDIFQFNARGFKLDSAIQMVIADNEYMSKLVTCFNHLVTSLKGAIKYVKAANVDVTVKQKIYKLIGLDDMLVKNLMYDDVATSVNNIKEIVSILDDNTVRLLIESSLMHRKRELELEAIRIEDETKRQEQLKELHGSLIGKIRELSINE